MSDVASRFLRPGLAAMTLVFLAACANENGAVPFDANTWSLETDPRGNPYPAAGG